MLHSDPEAGSFVIPTAMNRMMSKRRVKEPHGSSIVSSKLEHSRILSFARKRGWSVALWVSSAYRHVSTGLSADSTTSPLSPIVDPDRRRNSLSPIERRWLDTTADEESDDL